VPTADRIELAYRGEQAMRRRVEVRGLFGDPLSQRLDILRHGGSYHL